MMEENQDNSTGQYDASVLALSLTSSTLSVIASFVILGTFLAMPDIRKCIRKLILCLTLADFLTAAGYILGASSFAIDSEGPAGVCIVQSYITTYSSLVSFLLTIMTAAHIFTTVVYRSDFSETRRLLLYNAISWIIPGIIIVIAGSYKVLGASESEGTGPWCWIDSGANNMRMWQWVTGKGWELACYAVTISLYIILKLHRHLRQQYQRFHLVHASLRDEDQNFLYVWLVFYVMRIWGTVRFIVLVVNPTYIDSIYMKVLLHMQAFGDPSQAFCNCILFCLLDETVRRRLFGACFKNVCQNEELQDPNRSYTDDESEKTVRKTPIIGDVVVNYGSTWDETEHERHKNLQ